MERIIQSDDIILCLAFLDASPRAAAALASDCRVLQADSYITIS